MAVSDGKADRCNTTLPMSQVFCIDLFQGLADVVFAPFAFDDHVVCLISMARSVFEGEWVKSSGICTLVFRIAHRRFAF